MASKETDSIIAFLKASGVPHIVTDVDSPGIHTAWNPAERKYGAHYAPATGGTGLAVDFAFRRGAGESTPAELRAIYNAFVGVAQQGKLQELYYGKADWCVYGGRYMKWEEAPRAVRTTVRNSHKSHVHVSVRRGTLLRWQGPPLVQPVSQPTPTQVASQEDDEMPKPDQFVDACPAPGGGSWRLQYNGGIHTEDSPFFGSPFDIKGYTGPREFLSIDPAGPTRDDGYKVVRIDGKVFHFNLQWARDNGI